MFFSVKHTSAIVHCVVVVLACSLFVVAVRRISAQWPRAQLMALDNLRPKTFKYLYPRVDRGRLRLYEYYFERVQRHLGSRSAETFGLQGYCAYQRGDRWKAREFYKKALSINPHFFWYYYNLGVIYFNDREYDKALDMFETALNLDLTESFKFILLSQSIYLPILREYLTDLQQGLGSQLRDGQEQAFELALFAKLKLKGQRINGDQTPVGLMCY